MKLTVFGNNATCPEADGACSCYLLQTKGKRILLDMGNGSAAKLQKHLPLTQLDAIIISHLHFDHFGDLFCAKYALETKRAYGENLKPIPLFIPALPQGQARSYARTTCSKSIRSRMAQRMTSMKCILLFFAVKHLIESYGVRISAEGKTFAYSGDTGVCEGLYKVASGADAFLCESTFCAGETAEESHHLERAYRGADCQGCGVKQLFMTHYLPSNLKRCCRRQGRFPGCRPYADRKCIRRRREMRTKTNVKTRVGGRGYA